MRDQYRQLTNDKSQVSRYELSGENMGKAKEQESHDMYIYHDTNLFMIPNPQHASTLRASFSLVAPGFYHGPQSRYHDHSQRSVVAAA
jgi:hypothetical protein